MIVIEDLTKIYDGSSAAAVDGMSLKIERGEFLVFLGPSGVGKSTLLRCINQLVIPTSGRIFIDGREITNTSGRELFHARRGVGMIFQEYNLVGRMSVMMNVLSGRLGYISLWRALTYRFSKEDKDRARQALKRVGLDDEELIRRRTDALSGGQRQRVGIARALVQEPKVILADEPVASLDQKVSKVVMDILADIVEKDRITIVMSLHDVEMAKRYAKRILGLSKGKIIFDGRAEDLTPQVLHNIYE